MADILAKLPIPDWLPQPHNHKFSYKTTPMELVDLTQPSLWAVVGMIFFNPIFWNYVARNEYRNKSLTKIFGSPYLGCYALAVTIFSLGIFRDALYERVLRSQPHFEPLSHPLVQSAGWALVAAGQILAITSIYALGITAILSVAVLIFKLMPGTYLGDYFGILMTKRVTGFPFNILSDPMYVGSTLSFLGGALLYRSPVGLALTALVWTVYSAALQLEGPFTDMIYSAAHKKSSASSAPSTGRKPRISSGSAPGSAPSTPRKSSRLQAKASEVETDDESYAAAAASGPKDGPAVVTTPKKEPRMNEIKRSARKSRGGPGASSGSDEELIQVSGVAGMGAPSPARMTRSRSKGRNLGSDAE